MKVFVEEKRIKNKSQQDSFTKLEPSPPKDQENSLIIYCQNKNPSLLNKLKLKLKYGNESRKSHCYWLKKGSC